MSTETTLAEVSRISQGRWWRKVIRRKKYKRAKWGN